jgi:hypothetical protein
MKRWISALLLTAATLPLIACHRSGGATGAPAEATQPATPYLNRAQPRLPTLKLWLGDQELTTEVARRNVEIFTGMMFRTNIAESEAMLFVFPGTDRRSFTCATPRCR